MIGTKLIERAWGRLKSWSVYTERFVVRALLRRQIPDEDHLFFRVHRDFLDSDGEIRVGAFRDHGEHPITRGMSTDWAKYSTAEESRRRARRPEDNGVVSLHAGGVRAIPGLTVDHDPVWRNRAHSQVRGDKCPEARVKLRRLSEWRIRIPTDD